MVNLQIFPRTYWTQTHIQYTYLLVMKHYILHDQKISQIVLDFINQSHFKIPLATVEYRLKDTCNSYLLGFFESIERS